MKFIQWSTLIFLACWLPSGACQHLPSVPNFCAGDLCVGSGPVVSNDKLNYPSFSYSKGSNPRDSVYIIKYRDFGYIKLSLTPSGLMDCANINNGGNRKGVDSNVALYNQKLCKIMPNRKVYILDIFLSGLDATKSRDLCMQAFDGVWFFDSFSSTQKKYEPTYTRIDLNLECPK